MGIHSRGRHDGTAGRRVRAIRLASACLSLAYACLSPAFASEHERAITRGETTKAIEAHLQSTHRIGTAVAIVRHGVVSYVRGFGLRDVASREPVDADTRFEIGSNSKQFTAAAILQLTEAHRLALDDELAAYVPTFPHAGDVTIRQLLDQTTGLPDYVMTNHFVKIAQSSAGTLEEIERLAGGPLHFAPGARFEYSNTNYFALGRVVEVVSGESYGSYVRRHLFGPAGMHRTTTVDRPEAPDTATGYWRGLSDRGPLVKAPRLRASWAGGAGEIVSTVGDIAAWDAALQSGKIVTAPDYTLMTTSARLADGRRDEYGFGWWTDPLRGHERIYHDGDTFGMSASNNLFPGDDLAIIVLENEARDAAAETAAAIFRFMTGDAK